MCCAVSALWSVVVASGQKMRLALLCGLWRERERERESVCVCECGCV